MFKYMPYIKPRIFFAVTNTLILLFFNPVSAQEIPQRQKVAQYSLSKTLSYYPATTGSGDKSIPSEFHNPTGITYPFPSRGQDLPEGVYWHVTGHDNGSLRRDMSATRFNDSTGQWTTSHPASAGFEGDANRLIWNVPVYAPADGLILGCWSEALDGDDPAEAGCGDNPADPSALCRRPGGGNMVWLWVPEQERVFLMAHFRQGSVPRDICPHGNTEIANAKDKSGPFGLIPETANYFPFPSVKQGDFIGNVGNSGKSGGPHLHIEVRECKTPLTNINDDCKNVPLLFNKADIADKPSGRDVIEKDWVALNGPIPVTQPRKIVRPNKTIGGFIAPASLSIEQTDTPTLTVVLDVTNPASPVNSFQWEVVEPNTDIVFNDRMSASYKIDAHCPNGIDSITIETPANSSTEHFPFGEETISIEKELIGASREDVSNLCLDFAQSQSNSAICAQAPENCQSQLNTNFVGGVDGDDSMVRVRMQCHNGTVMEKEIATLLDLKCGLEPFGSIN